MQTEKLAVSSSDVRFEKALEIADGFTSALGLNKKDSLHIRLLVEEALGLVSSMTGEFFAQLWLEGDKNECRLRMEANSDVDADKKDELISLSTTGKNAAAKGFMGRLGDFIENWRLDYRMASEITARYSGGIVAYDNLSVYPGIAVADAAYWSLSAYRASANTKRDKDDDFMEDVERSIVANVSDDIIVGVKRDRISLTFVKRFD